MSDVEAFHKNLGDMLVAAERCIQFRQHLPALTLIYALIDSLAWAAGGKSQLSVRKRYEDWVNAWLMPNLRQTTPDVTATDLYAARCAVLHTLTGDSDLSRAGIAKRIMYAWGTGDPQVLRAVIEEAKISGHAALHYDHLLDAVTRATAHFLEAANHDPALGVRLEEAAGRCY